MFTSFRRIISLGWQNLVRDGGIAVANIFIMMVPILLVSSLFLLKEISQYLIESLQEKADISVYFNEAANEDEIAKIKEKISSMPEVKEVKYVSRDKALEDFTQRHKENPVLMESLDEVNSNPFLASLNVKAAGIGQYDEVAGLLEQEEYKSVINKINYHEKKSVIEKIFSLSEDARKTGLALFVILGIISVMVTYNTIRLAIINRAEEIEIQRLVGASDWFIRGQFVIEGVIFGLLSAVFCLLIASAACWYFDGEMELLLPGLGLWTSFTASLWTIFGIQLATGTGLGIVSSMIAITKYLKI